METIIKEQGASFFISILGQKNDPAIKKIVEIIKPETQKTVDNYIFEYGTFFEALSKMNRIICEEFPTIYCYANLKNKYVVSIVELTGLKPYHVLSFLPA